MSLITNKFQKNMIFNQINAYELHNLISKKIIHVLKI